MVKRLKTKDNKKAPSATAARRGALREARLAALFNHVDAPLRAIVPELAADKRALVGRALFSAVHGIVTLGLEERIDTLSHAAIGGQVATIVRACVAGLTGQREGDEVVRL